MSKRIVAQAGQQWKTRHVNPLLVSILAMPPQQLDGLMAELKAWCKAKHGRQKELAEVLHVTEDTISHWIARRKTPGLEKYLALQVFLKKRRRK
jgi:hypothetical protein